MHTFAEKPKAGQQTTSAKTTVPARAHFGQSHEVNSILHLQRTIGNQAVQRRLQTKSGELGGAACSLASSRLGHDFSRIPVSLNQVHARTTPEEPASLRSVPDICSQPRECNERLVDAGVGAAVGGVAGAAIGAAVGVPVGALVGAATSAVVGGVAGSLAGGGCTASATGVKLGASKSLKTSTRYGLITPIIVRGTNLSNVLDSELVSTSIDHTGSMKARPSAKSSNSGFMRADKIPPDQHTSGIADHLSYFDKHGGDGSYSRLQMDLFKIPKCGIKTAQDMPNSGYRLKRTVKKDGKKVVGIVTKTAEDVSIGSHKSTAGLTPKKEAKVILRP